MTSYNRPQEKIGGSIEHASILRKFTILFLLMSVIPMVVLYYFYIQIRDYGSVQLTPSEFNLTLTFIVLGIIVGYASMRGVLEQLVKMTEANRKVLESILSPEKIREFSQEKNEIAVLAHSFTVITERLEENIRSLELARKTLHSVMSKVGQGISDMQNIDTFLELILETVTEGLAGKMGTILLLNDDKNSFFIKTVYGTDLNTWKQIKIEIKEKSMLRSILDAKKPLLLSEDISDFQKVKECARWFKAPMICAPLVVKEKVLGLVIVSGRRMPGGFEENEIGLLANVASQTAVSIENSHLNEDMEKTYFETISALALAVDAKDKYSRGHLDRVAKYCVLIAKKLGLEEGDIQTLRDAARLHDLGKIGIPDEVLQKKGPLNHQEWLLMRKHPEIGESIIKPIRSLSHLCDIVRHHHEKLDGSGYPDGLKGDEIMPLARITTIADIYDALTSDRPYRPKMAQKEAYEQLHNMEDKIDQDIVGAFIDALNEQNDQNNA